MKVKIKMVGERRYKTWGCRAFMGAVYLFMQPVHAQMEYVEPTASLYGFHDDNVTLTTHDKTASAGYIVRGDLKMGSRYEYSDISLTAGVRRQQYLRVAALNTTDGQLAAQYLHHVERTRVALAVSYDADSSLTSELSTSGLVQVRKRRTVWGVAPAWQQQLTERLLLSLKPSHQQINYHDGLPSGLIDYQYTIFNGSLHYIISERLAGLMQLTYDRYAADQLHYTASSYGLMAGGSYAFAETLSVQMLLGIRQTDVDSSTGRDRSTGRLLDGSLTRVFTTASVRVGVNKSLTPSGSGNVLDTTQVHCTWNQSLAPRWHGVMVAELYRNRLPSKAANNIDRDYFSLAPHLRYTIARDWGLDFGYRYRSQKYTSRVDEAVAQTFFFTINFTPRRERADLNLTR